MGARHTHTNIHTQKCTETNEETSVWWKEETKKVQLCSSSINSEGGEYSWDNLPSFSLTELICGGWGWRRWALPGKQGPAYNIFFPLSAFFLLARGMMLHPNPGLSWAVIACSPHRLQTQLLSPTGHPALITCWGRASEAGSHRTPVLGCGAVRGQDHPQNHFPAWGATGGALRQFWLPGGTEHHYSGLQLRL